MDHAAHPDAVRRRHLLTLLIPQLTRRLIDDWLVPRIIEPGPVALLLAAMAATYVLRAGVMVFRNRGVARLSAGLVSDLRSASLRQRPRHVAALHRR